MAKVCSCPGFLLSSRDVASTVICRMLRAAGEGGAGEQGQSSPRSRDVPTATVRTDTRQGDRWDPDPGGKNGWERTELSNKAEVSAQDCRAASGAAAPEGHVSPDNAFLLFETLPTPVPTCTLL